MDEFTATVDDTDITGIERVTSQAFSFVLPADNVLGIDQPTPNPSAAVADGYWALLAPLSVGAHEIHFRGAASGLGFETEVTYSIEVVAPESSPEASGG